MLLVCFLNGHKEKALHAQNKAPKPQPLAVIYSLYWQMRHELISSEEGEGGEERGKAAA